MSVGFKKKKSGSEEKALLKSEAPLHQQLRLPARSRAAAAAAGEHGPLLSQPEPFWIRFEAIFPNGYSSIEALLS